VKYGSGFVAAWQVARVQSPGCMVPALLNYTGTHGDYPVDTTFAVARGSALYAD